MKFLANRKLASRIGIITTVITFAGMLLLWVIVSGRIASMVESNITNQMVDAVESRASIINDYVSSAEESADVSKELSNQANTLKNLIGQFKVE